MEETMQRIEGLMLAAGYLPASVASIPPFDKINGGLSWLIHTSNADVDLDLFYNQQTNLQQKLKVGEAIELALQKMNCPYPLQAHQIQGLDYEAIYAVVQWLVKTVIATQQMHGDQMCRSSYCHLNEDYKLNDVKSKTLLMHEANDGKRKHNLPQEMSSNSISHERPPDQSLTNATLDSEDAHAAAAQYSDKSFHQRQADIILKQTMLEEKNNEILQVRKRDLTEKISKLKDTANQQEKEKLELSLASKKLNEKVERAGVTRILQAILLFVEQQMVSQDEQCIFQTSCGKRHTELLENIRKLQTESDELSQGSYKSDLESGLQRELLRLKAIKADAAKIWQKVLSCSRKLEEFPCQAELMQYERCFVELYLNIQAKLLETRKYYASYNALAEANELTMKEISLLNSINTQFEQATISHEGRKKFADSMCEIAKGTQLKLEKMEARLVHEQNCLATLKEKHQTMVAERRQYVNMVKLFQDECSKNETLKSASQLSG